MPLTKKTNLWNLSTILLPLTTPYKRSKKSNLLIHMHRATKTKSFLSPRSPWFFDFYIWSPFLCCARLRIMVNDKRPWSSLSLPSSVFFSLLPSSLPVLQMPNSALSHITNSYSPYVDSRSLSCLSLFSRSPQASVWISEWVNECVCVCVCACVLRVFWMHLPGCF